MTTHRCRRASAVLRRHYGDGVFAAVSKEQEATGGSLRQAVAWLARRLRCARCDVIDGWWYPCWLHRGRGE